MASGVVGSSLRPGVIMKFTFEDLFKHLSTFISSSGYELNLN